MRGRGRSRLRMNGPLARSGRAPSIDGTNRIEEQPGAVPRHRIDEKIAVSIIRRWADVFPRHLFAAAYSPPFSARRRAVFFPFFPETRCCPPLIIFFPFYSVALWVRATAGMVPLAGLPFSAKAGKADGPAYRGRKGTGRGAPENDGRKLLGLKFYTQKVYEIGRFQQNVDFTRIFRTVRASGNESPNASGPLTTATRARGPLTWMSCAIHGWDEAITGWYIGG